MSAKPKFEPFTRQLQIPLMLLALALLSLCPIASARKLQRIRRLLSPVLKRLARSSHAGAAEPGLPTGKKLMLKDGSFQLVREYEVDGDRVRYFSIDQRDWEEIPASLVDWDATKKSRRRRAGAQGRADRQSGRGRNGAARRRHGH